MTSAEVEMYEEAKRLLTGSIKVIEVSQAYGREELLENISRWLVTYHVAQSKTNRNVMVLKKGK